MAAAGQAQGCGARASHTRFAPGSNPAPSDAGLGEGSGLHIAQEAPNKECEGLEGQSSWVQPGAHCDGDGGN